MTSHAVNCIFLAIIRLDEQLSAWGKNYGLLDLSSPILPRHPQEHRAFRWYDLTGLFRLNECLILFKQSPNMGCTIFPMAALEYVDGIMILLARWGDCSGLHLCAASVSSCNYGSLNLLSSKSHQCMKVEANSSVSVWPCTGYKFCFSRFRSLNVVPDGWKSTEYIDSVTIAWDIRTATSISDASLAALRYFQPSKHKLVWFSS